MSRIDTLTSKEQVAEDVPQEMLIIGALHYDDQTLEKGGEVIDAESVVDWDEVMEKLYLHQDEVLTAEYLIPNHKNLSLSQISDENQGDRKYLSFRIFSPKKPSKTLLKVFVKSSVFQEGECLRGDAETIREKINTALQEIIDDGFIPDPMNYPY